MRFREVSCAHWIPDVIGILHWLWPRLSFLVAVKDDAHSSSRPAVVILVGLSFPNLF